MNMEAMLAMFVLVSFLALHVYLNKERKLIYLIISGMSFGLAQLTKSSSIALIALIGLMLLVNIFKKDENPLRNVLQPPSLAASVTFAIKTFGIWILSAGIIYFILWPGMWVDPSRMLGEVYGNAFSYAFQGARLDVTEELEPTDFHLENRIDGLALYLTYWFSGTTFITWLGLIFAGFYFFSKEKLSWLVKSTIIYLLILASLFILIFGLVQGRNHAHYIMSTFVALDVVAGIGWGRIWLVVQKQFKRPNEAYVSLIFVVILAFTQIGFGLPYAPYYFTYKNPFAKQPATFGYGEGYNLAADYLNSKPNSQEIKAYVYNGMGTFSYLFVGETLVFKRVYVVDESYEQIVEDTKASDYLVLYPVIREKQPETEKLFTAFENAVPEKIIVINGIDYVYIYNVAEIPESVYEALKQ
jgi:4-amino-4-deoxy-L-arabinose transferase-like glycosyltransferase